MKPGFAHFVVIVLFTCGVTFFHTTKLEANHEVFVDKYRKQLERLNEKLIKAIEKDINRIRKNRELDAEAKQTMVAYSNDQIARFKRHGYLPFAPHLQNHSTTYLRELHKLRSPLERAFDVSIENATIMNQNNLAAELLSQKQNILAPITIAKWNCIEGNARRRPFSWTLYSDGTMAGGITSWYFEGTKLIIINGKFRDTCAISVDGKHLKAANQFGGLYSGVLVDP